MPLIKLADNRPAQRPQPDALGRQRRHAFRIGSEGVESSPQPGHHRLLADDSQGNIWVGTSEGLVRLTPALRHLWQAGGLLADDQKSALPRRAGVSGYWMPMAPWAISRAVALCRSPRSAPLRAGRCWV